MLPNEVQKRIEAALPHCIATVSEFSGGTDHYSVTVVTDAFMGISLLKRHRMVMDLFKSEIATGEVHALSIHAYTTEQWKGIQQ